MTSCILHIGLQKTGSTALQSMLGATAPLLEEAGFYYPASCRQYGGHPNAPRDLVGSPAFDARFGTFASLLDEIASQPDRCSIVSSEAFPILIDRAGATQAMADAMRGAGIQARVVMYVRDQASYIESLYAQRLKRGMTLGFRPFAQAILVNGQFVMDETLKFRFEYSRIAQPFASAFGAHSVVARPYPSQAEPEVLARDFLSTIGVDRDRIAAFPIERVNTTANLGTIVQRWFANIERERPVGPDPASLARELFGDAAPAVMAQPFRVFDARAAERVMNRFEDDNVLLERQFGARPIVRLERASDETPAQQLLDEAEARWA